MSSTTTDHATPPTVLSQSVASWSVPRWPHTNRWLPGATVVALGALLLVAWGVSGQELVRYVAYWAVVVALPGVIAWRALGPRLRYGIEDVATGVALGYAAETVMRIVASVAGAPPRLGDLTPLVLALVALAVPTSRARLRRPWVPLPRRMAWAYAALLAVVFLWLAFGYFARQPVSWSGRGGPENDLLFAIALAGDAVHHWPLEFPWVQGEPLLYHWFFAEHLASAHELTGVQLPSLVLRLEILPAVAVVALTTGALATRLSNRPWSGPLAVGLLLVVQDASPIPWSQLAASPTADLTGPPYIVSFWWSTSGAFAAVVFGPLAVLLIDLVRHETTRGSWALLAVLLLVGAGSKASILPVVLVAVGSVVLATWWLQRRLHRPALAALVMSAATFLVTWRAIYGGQPQGLELSPLRHVTTTPLGGAVLGEGVSGRSPLVALFALGICVVASLVAFAGVGLVVADRAARSDPAVLLCLGALLLGTAGMVLLYHHGQSNLYFLRTALPLLAAGAAWGVCAAGVSGRDRRAVRGMGLAFVVGVIGMALLSTRSWSEFAPSESATVRLLQVAVPWGALALVGVATAWVVRRATGVRGLATGALVVAFLAGCGAVRVPGQVVVWGTQHPVGWVADAANPLQHIDAGGVRAAQWIRDHGRSDDVVVTNVLCANGSSRQVPVCDNRTFWVPAYAELRTVVSGWGYTATTNRLASRAGYANFWQYPFWDQPRLDRVRDFLAEPTPAGAEAFGAEGARWVLAVDGYDEVSPQMQGVADVAFRTGGAVVYRLPGR